jgi:hypothetical protein
MHVYAHFCLVSNTEFYAAALTLPTNMEMAVFHTAFIESIAHVTVTVLLEQLVTALCLKYEAVAR